MGRCIQAEKVLTVVIVVAGSVAATIVIVVVCKASERQRAS